LKKGEPDDKAPRKADRAAIDAQLKGFVEAFEAGDAERVAAFWTEGGELDGDDGTVYRGRAAIARAYRELFAGKEKRKAEVHRHSLRFPSKDTAIDEGHFEVRVGKGGPTTSRYTVLHVREGGKWLMAVVREWPADAVDLEDLGWLIGTWEARGADAEVRTTYEWVWDKSFIRMQFSVRRKDRTTSGFQMIGKDPASGQLRSWTFEGEGGFGEATWSRDGERWVLDTTARLADGSALAATVLLVPAGRDAFTWQATRRSIDGEAIDDLAPVKVTRVKKGK
jgi:uncharacterized protein (TIGR02246 family)